MEKNNTNKGSGKIFGRFNIIDIFVVILVVAIIVFGASKLFSKSSEVSVKQTKQISYVVYFDDAADFIPDAIEVGAPVIEGSTESAMGTVTDVTLSTSEKLVYDITKGDVVQVPLDGQAAFYVTIEANATVTENGFLLSSVRYGIGQSLTVYMGNTKCSGRVYSFEVIE